MIKKRTSKTAVRPAVPKEAALAYEKVEGSILKLRAEELLPINIDIPRSVSIALGALTQLDALRPELAQELPRRASQAVDSLGTHALAAWYAHLLALPNAEEDTLKKLLAEAVPLRADMLIAAELLAHKSFLDPDAVAEIRSGQGNVDTANDLVALAALFAQNWSAVHNKSTVEWTDVERAAELGPLLLVALGERRQPGFEPKGRDAMDRRQRAFTLFVQTYDEVRRAVAYLRWRERDTEMFAPSLYTRGTRRVEVEEAPEQPAPTVPPAAAPVAPPPAPSPRADG